MADGELNPRQAEQVTWDVIVVGTGMGGGMLGYSLARSRRRVLFVEKGFRKITLRTAKNNVVLAHVCGTCRFGTDPKSSVLDPQNRAHEVDNLYVVDSSFFPSSTGINPSLTVAANALRVAAHVNQVHFAT